MRSQDYWRYAYYLDLLNYLTNYSTFYGKPVVFWFFFIFDDRPISLEAPNHFDKNSPVPCASEKIIWPVLFKNEPSNHQLVPSLSIPGREKVLSIGRQPGTVPGALRHVVQGQVSLESRGAQDTAQRQTVPLCDSSSQSTDGAWYRAAPRAQRAERGSVLESLKFNRATGCPSSQKVSGGKICETP